MLSRVGILAAPTFRSRAYAQWLVRAGLVPGHAILLADDEPDWTGPAQLDFHVAGAPAIFEPGVTAGETLHRAGCQCRVLSADIGSDEFVAAVSRLPVDVIIYSGPGGVLVPSRVLAAKRFLHIHGGWAPRFRGSTAFYYGLLEEGAMGATAIWLDEGIDTGPVLARLREAPTHHVDIDRIFDPCLRAELLTKVLAEYKSTGVFPEEQVSASEDAMTYFVIHPVLKHLVLRRQGLVPDSREA